MPKQKTSVRVAGKAYTLISDEAPGYMENIAAYVDRTISETVQATRMQLQDAAVLTALNLADELNKSRNEVSLLRRQLMAAQQVPEVQP